jgi:hypothetical protein
MARCNDKAALVLAYTNAAKQYSDAVTDLHERMSTISKTEYHKLYDIAETARETVEAARLAIA